MHIHTFIGEPWQPGSLGETSLNPGITVECSRNKKLDVVIHHGEQNSQST